MAMRRKLEDKMMEKLLFSLTFAAAMGTGLVAGTLFAFSTFVMRSLGAIPASEGIAAMQSINLIIVRSIFIPVMFGTALIALLLCVRAVIHWGQTGSAMLLIAGLVYIIGAIVETMVLHIPRNNVLAALDPNSVAAAQYWRSYLASWTSYNHIRTAAALIASALYISVLTTGAKL
jgi:uncharacterized membrane protein